ncbi:hypothetical protein KKB10_02955 [Patescibacteria group bacterium]|nr:hypothetical protein [Patescibacteria group bacterium]MBU1074832.1 hypothetical protein [Patescibacteria group bacterium]MBU1952159.1 hypothetical protein [Patescibacteria group bacterium]MBU2229113.1 hypothetical protein [Patescibacteria group bacterium]MBU2236116.1 hypothetical protein [Patescibacteria group bacterium]
MPKLIVLNNKNRKIIPILLIFELAFIFFPHSDSKAYTYGGQKWSNGKAGYYLDIAGWDPTLIVYPAHTWNDAGSPFRFNFKGHNIYHDRDGKNTVTRFTMNNSRPAETRLRWNGNSLSEADVVFNMRYGWGCCGEPNLYDVKNAMTHEFGHWLVLLDQNNPWDYWDTMYKTTYPGETRKRTLHSDDRNGINYIY